MSSNVKLLTQAQRMLEELRVNFESQYFTRTISGVTVTIKGTLEMTNVSGGESIPLDALMRAHMETLHVVKYARSIAMVQVRNKLLKSHFDILSLMPEVREAVEFLNRADKPESYLPD